MPPPTTSYVGSPGCDTIAVANLAGRADAQLRDDAVERVGVDLAVGVGGREVLADDALQADLELPAAVLGRHGQLHLARVPFETDELVRGRRAELETLPIVAPGDVEPRLEVRADAQVEVGLVRVLVDVPADPVRAGTHGEACRKSELRAEARAEPCIDVGGGLQLGRNDGAHVPYGNRAGGNEEERGARVRAAGRVARGHPFDRHGPARVRGRLGHDRVGQGGRCPECRRCGQDGRDAAYRLHGAGAYEPRIRRSNLDGPRAASGNDRWRRGRCGRIRGRLPREPLPERPNETRDVAPVQASEPRDAREPDGEERCEAGARHVEKAQRERSIARHELARYDDAPFVGGKRKRDWGDALDDAAVHHQAAVLLPEATCDALIELARVLRRDIRPRVRALVRVLRFVVSCPGRGGRWDGRRHVLGVRRPGDGAGGVVPRRRCDPEHESHERRARPRPRAAVRAAEGAQPPTRRERRARSPRALPTRRARRATARRGRRSRECVARVRAARGVRSQSTRPGRVRRSCRRRATGDPPEHRDRDARLPAARGSASRGSSPVRASASARS